MATSDKKPDKSGESYIVIYYNFSTGVYQFSTPRDIGTKFINYKQVREYMEKYNASRETPSLRGGWKVVAVRKITIDTEGEVDLL